MTSPRGVDPCPTQGRMPKGHAGDGTKPSPTAAAPAQRGQIGSAARSTTRQMAVDALAAGG
jgi:hypothetical protein